MRSHSPALRRQGALGAATTLAAVAFTTSAAGATTHATTVESPVISVSYRDPPSDLLLYPFAELDLPNDLGYAYVPDVAVPKRTRLGASSSNASRRSSRRSASQTSRPGNPRPRRRSGSGELAAGQPG
jgi:hypothetical protein